MKVFRTYLALTALCLPMTASAAIQTVIISLNAETQVVANIQSYVVPTNKILVIENIFPSDPQQDLIIDHTSTSVRVDIRMSKFEHVDAAGSTVEQGGGLLISYQPSLKIPGGWRVRLHEDTFGDEITITIFGLLVDPEDLYAAIPSSIESYAMTGPSTIQAVSRLDAPRQALTRFDGSPDLATWTETTNVTETMGAPRDVHTFTLAINPAVDEAFQRAAFRSRRGSAGMPH